MKKYFSQPLLKLFAVAMIFVIGQSFTAQTAVQDTIPAEGCLYLKNPDIYCVWGNYGVLNCANSDKTTCGVSNEDLPSEP